VAGHSHGHPLRHAAVNHVPHGRPPEVVADHLQEARGLPVGVRLHEFGPALRAFRPVECFQVQRRFDAGRLPRFPKVINASPAVLATEVGEEIRNGPTKTHFKNLYPFDLRREHDGQFGREIHEASVGVLGLAGFKSDRASAEVHLTPLQG